VFQGRSARRRTGAEVVFQGALRRRAEEFEIGRVAILCMSALCTTDFKDHRMALDANGNG
jgi:hypothetical protein